MIPYKIAGAPPESITDPEPSPGDSCSEFSALCLASFTSPLFKAPVWLKFLVHSFGAQPSCPSVLVVP
eukprot:5355674-Pyramimonas_sp.AAC.1